MVKSSKNPNSPTCTHKRIRLVKRGYIVTSYEKRENGQYREIEERVDEMIDKSPIAWECLDCKKLIDMGMDEEIPVISIITPSREAQIEAQEAKLTEIAMDLIGFFASLLADYNIFLPDQDRTGDPEESTIFGANYYLLEEELKICLKSHRIHTGN